MIECPVNLCPECMEPWMSPTDHCERCGACIDGTCTNCDDSRSAQRPKV